MYLQINGYMTSFFHLHIFFSTLHLLGQWQESESDLMGHTTKWKLILTRFSPKEKIFPISQEIKDICESCLLLLKKNSSHFLWFEKYYTELLLMNPTWLYRYSILFSETWQWESCLVIKQSIDTHQSNK